MNKQTKSSFGYWCFVTDNDGHWYKIPVEERENFYKWVELMEDDHWDSEDSGFFEEVDFINFDNFKSMHPLNYMFKRGDLEVLKELVSD